MTVLRFLLAAWLRIAGAMLLLAAAALAAPHAGLLAPGADGAPPIWLPILAAAVAALYLRPPHGLGRPRRRRDAFWIGLHLGLAATLPAMGDAVAAIEGLPAGAARLLDPVLAAAIPSLLVLALVVSRPEARDPRALDRRAPPAASRGRLGRPDMGGLMRLLAVADGAGPRLIGLGLLAAAWSLWRALARGDAQRAADLAQGLPPVPALALQTGLGIALALPILLTPWVGHPRHVAGGLAKAAVIAVAAWLLQAPLRLALAGALDDMHRPLALAVVPPVVLALAAIVALAAPALALSRQLGAGPGRAPGEGDAPAMNPATLRDLRLARMRA